MKTLKKWIVDLFYIPKYEKVSDKSFSRILLSSIFGAFICVFCLSGLTWAWFTSSVSSNANTISAAKFDVVITVKNNDSNTEVTPNIDGSYSLENDEFSVTVKATGDASTGYCKIVLNEQEYHSIQLFPAGGEGKRQDVSFTVTASSACTLTIVPQWGSYANSGNESLVGDTLVNIPAVNSVSNQQNLLLVENTETSADTTTIVTSEGEPTYTLTDTEQLYPVHAGDTLEGIASLFGTTTDVLSAYNEIQDASYIQAGATIKIPPVSYTVPAAAGEQTTADNSTVDTPAADTSVQSAESPSEQPADNPEPVESTSQQAAATPEPVESTSQQAAATPEPAESTSQQSIAASEAAESTAEAAASTEATTSSASTDPEPISE